ncbi:MAG: hypothetical protein KAU36_05445, partial [candidate division Zixibacteria bacterium]|nr:hypothetical protein [candidate division Zixibacteria bacterium]
MSWLAEQIALMGNIFYYLIQVVHWTILISLLAYLIALVLGLVFGIARISRNSVVRWFAGA